MKTYAHCGIYVEFWLRSCAIVNLKGKQLIQVLRPMHMEKHDAL